MISLQAVRRKRETLAGDGYPFHLPFVQQLDKLEFRTPVTFFVGENGSGKSTILEAIAAGVDAITAGGSDVRHDPSLAPLRQLAEQLTFVWAKRTHRGFFLRAEDFSNFGAAYVRLFEEALFCRRDEVAHRGEVAHHVEVVHVCQSHGHHVEEVQKLSQMKVRR